MSAARPRWPTPLADVPDFPRKLVEPLAAHGLRTVGDLVARIKRHNPGLLPPSSAYYLHLRTNSYPLTAEAPELCAAGQRALVNWLDYPAHLTPANWADPPGRRPAPAPTPEPEAPMPPNPRTLPTASLELHPEAHLVPEMPRDQYATFLADVRAKGVLVPIEVLPGTRTVIEGRTRLKAATEAGLPSVPVVDADLGDHAPVVYMIRAAYLRRQLTAGQRAALGVELEKQKRKAARERQKAGAKKGGAAKGAKVVELVPQASPPPPPAKPSRARDEAAAEVGVNPRYISDAKKVEERSPAVFEKLKAGEVTLPEAKRLTSPPPPPPPAKPPEPAPTPSPKNARTVAVEPIDPARPLAPCPFCGSTEHALRVLIGGMRVIVCEGCQSRGPEAAEASVARDNWNKRSQP